MVLRPAVPVGTVLDSVAEVTGVHRRGAYPCPIAADDYSHDLRDPVVQDLEVPSLAGMVDAVDIGSVPAAHQHGLAFGDQDSHQDHRTRCLVEDREVVVVPVAHPAAKGRNLPDTGAEVSNFLANVANTVAIEDCVADMVTFAVDQASLHLVHRDLVPSYSRHAYAADVVVVSDILELPCRLAVAGDPAVAAAALAGHRLTMRKEDDSAMLLSNGRVAAAAAAIAIDYRGLDYYYYYLVDSVADLELGSDY